MSAINDIIAIKSEKILEEKCVQEWTLKNIDKTIPPIRTPIFSATENTTANFYFDVLFLRENVGHNNEYTMLQVILRKLSESSSPDLHFHLSVAVHYSSGKLYVEYKSGNPIALNSFTSKTCIKEQSCTCRTIHGESLQTNTLVLKSCMISFGHLLAPKSYYNQTLALQDLKSFTKNFAVLYQSNDLSDVDIQVGDQTFKSHKFILATHSPVFKTMLMQDFLEARRGVITISDTKSDVFERFLKFLYSGEVEEKSFSNFEELYPLADKYDVQILKQECYKILNDFSINEEEMSVVFHLAYQCNDDKLKQLVMQLLKSSIRKEIEMQ